MRPLWGVDISRNKKNDHPDGDMFIVASTSAAKEAEMNKATEQAKGLNKKADMPLWMKIIYYPCGIFALIVLLGILRADVTFEEGYRNAPALHWIGGACGVIAVALFIYSKLKKSKVEKSIEYVEAGIRLGAAAEEATKELGIPASAEDVDVLIGKYKLKDGKLKFCAVAPISGATFMNFSCSAFVEDGALCLADLSHKYAIPLSELTCIRKVKKRVAFRGWNKSVPFNEPPYKEFKFAANQYGDVFSKTHYILEFRHSSETWGVYFLPYELPVFTRLTGITDVTESED